MLTPNIDIKKLMAQLELMQNNTSEGYLKDIMQGAAKTDYASTANKGLNIPNSLQGAIGNNYNNLASQGLNPDEVDETGAGFAFDPTQDSSMATLLTDLNEKYKNGDIDFEEYKQMYGEYDGDPKDMLEENNNQNGLDSMMGFLNSGFYANSLGTSAYNIGRFAGMEPGTQGKGLGLVGNIGDFTLGAARGIVGGLAQSKGNRRVQNYYDQRKGQDDRFVANPQTRNTNTTGGLAGFEDGGEVLRQLYQQQTEEVDPRFRVGEYVEFEYGGKVKKGKIKKVVDGKIYL